MTGRQAPFRAPTGVVQKLATADQLDTHLSPPTADAEDLVLEVTLSTDAPDRDGDRVRLEGWDLENFRRNPVVLWAHDSALPPVGKVCDLFRDGKSLKARIAFTPKEVNPFGYMTYRLYAGGFLRGVSVGFLPKKWQPLSAEDQAGQVAEGKAPGLDYVQQELLEVSCVPLPANPQALVTAQRQGIDMAPLQRWSKSASLEKQKILNLPQVKALIQRDLEVNQPDRSQPASLPDPAPLTPDVLSQRLDLLAHRLTILEQRVEALPESGQGGQSELLANATPSPSTLSPRISEGEKALAALIARSVVRRINQLSGAY